MAVSWAVMPKKKEAVCSYLENEHRHLHRPENLTFQNKYDFTYVYGKAIRRLVETTSVNCCH
jgi:hypothetical protein